MTEKVLTATHETYISDAYSHIWGFLEGFFYFLFEFAEFILDCVNLLRAICNYYEESVKIPKITQNVNFPPGLDNTRKAELLPHIPFKV